MITVRCTYANGDSIVTSFNGTFDTAVDYFLNKTFNLGTTAGPLDYFEDNLQECVNVEDLTYLNYDYKNQAWVEKGLYIKCGHTEDMNCNCYGKLHEGEAANTLLTDNYTDASGDCFSDADPGL